MPQTAPDQSTAHHYPCGCFLLIQKKLPFVKDLYRCTLHEVKFKMAMERVREAGHDSRKAKRIMKDWWKGFDGNEALKGSPLVEPAGKGNLLGKGYELREASGRRGPKKRVMRRPGQTIEMQN